MVEIFGAILRHDLVALIESMATPHGFNWNCSDSTESDTLSINSSESFIDVSQDLINIVESIPEVQH